MDFTSRFSLDADSVGFSGYQLLFLDIEALLDIVAFSLDLDALAPLLITKVENDYAGARAQMLDFASSLNPGKLVLLRVSAIK